MIRVTLSLVMLTAVYVLTLSSVEPWDFVIGAVIALALLILFRQVTIGHHGAHLPGLAGRLVAFFPFVARVGLDIVVGAWRVALVILGIRSSQHAKVVAVPIQGRSHRGIAVTALVTTLAPGSYFIGVDWDRHVMLFHFLEAWDPEAIQGTMAQFYSRYQSRVFP